MQHITKVFFFLLLSWQLNAQNADINLLRRINVDRNPSLDGFFRGVTDSDSPISIGIPAVLLTVGLIKKDSLTIQNALCISGSILISSVISTGLKYGVQRDRPFTTYPDIVKLTHGGSPSFPSGHTSLAFSFATSISILYPKWYVIAPTYVFATSVAYSRMHLGVHYPSDVLVGAFIGSGSAWLSWYLTNKIQQTRRNKALRF